MADNINNKQLFLKKLIYRSRYTGMKETDLLLGKFSKKHLHNLSYEDLISYEKLILSTAYSNKMDYTSFLKLLH